jgi:hypothetical protein
MLPAAEDRGKKKSARLEKEAKEKEKRRRPFIFIQTNPCLSAASA